MGNRTLSPAAPAVAVLLAALAGCSGPVVIHAAEVKSFTGIELCPAAGVRDVTTQEEHDAPNGYAYHVELTLNDTCRAAFEKELAEMAPDQCPLGRVPNMGCAIDDASTTGRTDKKTSVAVGRWHDGKYDLYFYQ